jgi:hypothetical protein
MKMITIADQEIPARSRCPVDIPIFHYGTVATSFQRKAISNRRECHVSEIRYHIYAREICLSRPSDSQIIERILRRIVEMNDPYGKDRRENADNCALPISHPVTLPQAAIRAKPAIPGI